jgi:hypothetical protein
VKLEWQNKKQGSDDTKSLSVNRGETTDDSAIFPERKVEQ